MSSEIQIFGREADLIVFHPNALAVKEHALSLGALVGTVFDVDSNGMAVNAMRFIVPVSVGDLVSVYGWVEQVGRTSIRVRVEAFAERDRDLNQLHAVATATLTYVAMDEHCRPRPVRM